MDSVAQGMTRTEDAVLDGSVAESQGSEQGVDGERHLGHGVFPVMGLGEPSLMSGDPLRNSIKGEINRRHYVFFNR